MRAISRVTGKWLAAALALAPVAVAAQQTTPTSNSTTSDTVGPPQLQNFSLPGTVTRPADRPTTSAPATVAPATMTDTNPVPRTPPPRPSARSLVATAPAPRAEALPGRRTAAPAPIQAVQPPPSPPPVVSTTAASQPRAEPAPSFTPAQTAERAPPSRPAIPLFAWLLSAMALGVGGALLFRRSRARQAYAGGEADEYAAPEAPPQPPPLAPRPAPAPPPPPPPLSPAPARAAVTPTPVPQAPATPTGIVSTRLRPRLEVGFRPTRCVLDQERATIDFELELFNAGSAPARDIAVDAAAFNAGADQNAMIAGFFENRRKQGQAVEVLAPLDRTVVPLQLVLPRDQLQPYELGGQQVFVPLIAFNATFASAAGSGQTCASYLLGRQTESEKLAPFRIDAGPRIFRNLAAKALPGGIMK